MWENDWQLKEAWRLKYWSKIEQEDKNLASYLTSSGLKTMIGILNDHHIKIVHLASLDDPCFKECLRLYDLYSFDLLFQKIKNFVQTFDDKVILKICHESDPEWDSSGELVETLHRVNLRSINSLYDVLGLYTGNKMASHTSGCGWTYVTLGEEITWVIRDFIYDEHQVRDHQALLQLVGATERTEDTWSDAMDFIVENMFEDFVLVKVVETSATWIFREKKEV